MFAMNLKQYPKLKWILIATVFSTFVYVVMNYYSHDRVINYYNDVFGEVQFLKNILKMEVPLGESIFFLDTGAIFNETGKIRINPRAACSVESAARAHPDRLLFMLYATRGLTKFEAKPSAEIIQLLATYKNIHFGYINLDEYGRGTPLEVLIMKKATELSPFKVVHTSDMLRILTLWRYGGIYMDTDVIVLKSFDPLAVNFIGLEMDTSAANGVLGFSHTGAGHDHISTAMIMFANNYNPESWGGNGPALFSKLIRRVCKVDKLTDAIDKECEELAVYPPKYFYPIYAPADVYFHDQDNQKVLEMINNSYATHLWNKLTYTRKIRMESNAPYLNLGRKYCPRTISAVKNFF